MHISRPTTRARRIRKSPPALPVIAQAFKYTCGCTVHPAHIATVATIPGHGGLPWHWHSMRRSGVTPS